MLSSRWEAEGNRDSEPRKHLRAACREVLLALRSLLDRALGEEEKPAPQVAQGPTPVRLIRKARRKPGRPETRSGESGEQAETSSVA